MKAAIISQGRSFRGITSYMLNPKRGGDGAERADWSLALNCGTDNAATAAKVMAFTATHAEDIKAAARAEGHKIGTRRSNAPRPVLHLVMSWEEGETPTAAHQQQAARDMLKAMGLENAQALAVAHTDTKNPHVHIAVNLVRPDLGTMWDTHDNAKKMQAWALVYEKNNGGVVTPAREANSERRKAGEKVEGPRRLNRAEYEQMQASARQSWAQRKAARDEAFSRQADERGQLRAQHGEEWKAAKAEAAAHRRAHDQLFRAALKAAKDADKAANKPLWRDLFRRHRAEAMGAAGNVDAAQVRARGAAQITANARRLARVSERFERSFIARKVLKPLGFDVSADRPRALLAAAMKREAEARQVVAEVAKERAALTVAQEAERRALAASLSAATLAKVKAAVASVNPVDFAAMIERQAEERRRQIEAHNAERAALGMKPYQPRRKEAESMDRQGIEKNADRARQAFAANTKPQAPQQAAPRVQGAQPTLTPPGQTTGTTPAAPTRSAEDMRAALQAGVKAADAKAAEKANSPEAKQAVKDAFAKAQQKRKDGPSL